MKTEIKITERRIPKPLFRNIHRVLPVLCVDIVVTHGRKFLLVERKNAPAKGFWWPPGGRLLKNERIIDAVQRKLREETGLTGGSPQLLGAAEHFSNPGYFKGFGSHTVVFVFKIEASSFSTVKLDSQSSKSGWFSAINPSWHPYVRDCVRAARSKNHSRLRLIKKFSY